MLFAGCRSSHEVAKAETTVTAASERHADSVVLVSSLGVRETLTEVETVTIVERPDSTGALREVARDVKRTTKRERQTTQQADTSSYHSEAVETREADTVKETEKTVEPAERPATGRERAAAFGAGIWFAFSALAVFLGIIMWLKWKSRI
mgnify:CR=1 FL=1